MKKLAVVVSGWHFPYLFFKQFAEQQIPEGWEVDLFCVSHRHPKFSAEEKKEMIANFGLSYREVLDRMLYEKVAMPEDIEALGWHYKEYPNDIGDFGNMNQWLAEHEYKDYDMFIISHDDNYMPSDQIYMDLVAPESDWLIATNSTGSALNLREFVKVRILGRALNIRGSFELMKPEIIERIGGTFDMSGVTLHRQGETSSGNFKTLNNWNMTVEPFRKFLDKNGLSRRIKALSKTYRVSDYCIEGERGMISSYQEPDKASYFRGLDYIQKRYDEKRAL